METTARYSDALGSKFLRNSPEKYNELYVKKLLFTCIQYTKIKDRVEPFVVWIILQIFQHKIINKIDVQSFHAKKKGDKNNFLNLSIKFDSLCDRCDVRSEII